MASKINLYFSLDLGSNKHFGNLFAIIGIKDRMFILTLPIIVVRVYAAILLTSFRHVTSVVFTFLAVSKSKSLNQLDSLSWTPACHTAVVGAVSTGLRAKLIGSRKQPLRYLGPVVQNFVSLTSSYRPQHEP